MGGKAQLAGLSLRGQADAAGFVADFTGSHRYVLDFLTQEVLERQPEQVRVFLLETSVLERLSARCATRPPAAAGQYFSGRGRVLTELVAWLTTTESDGTGRIVTGNPGCGKSAVLGRIVALSDPDYRARLTSRRPTRQQSCQRILSLSQSTHGTRRWRRSSRRSPPG